ncbi:hypothetical protein N431DRAFT_470428 [Stipitochalara longipes BDJ]|nr:hypothetical protein N431DRAFT_470428 [Stipitochalara longipes BDJ]
MEEIELALGKKCVNLLILASEEYINLDPNFINNPSTSQDHIPAPWIKSRFKQVISLINSLQITKPAWSRKHSRSDASTHLHPYNSNSRHNHAHPIPSHLTFSTQTRQDKTSSSSAARMCVEITYLYPHCGCIARIGSYACYHASHTAKTGFSLCCARYKTTEQETRTGARACEAHVKLLAREGKVKRKKVREEGAGGEGEGEVMSGAVEGFCEGECESEGEGDAEHGERVIGHAA